MSGNGPTKTHLLPHLEEGMPPLGSQLRAGFRRWDKMEDGIVPLTCLQKMLETAPVALPRKQVDALLLTFSQMSGGGTNVRYNDFIDWLVQPATTTPSDGSGGDCATPAASTSNAKVTPTATGFMSLPGLGEGDFPGFPADTCPASLPDLAMNRSVLAEVLRSDPSLYPRFVGRCTSFGVTLARCIKPAMDDPSSLGLGLVAGDAECYDEFRELFAGVAQQVHRWLPSGPHPEDLSASSVSSQPVDFSGKYAVSVQLRCYRNLRNLRFLPACSREERIEVEQMLVGAFMQLSGDDLRGNYFPLQHSSSLPSQPAGMSDKEAAAVRKQRFLFHEPDSWAQLASGIGRQWPEARGVFVADSHCLVAWCNESDHLQLMSRQCGGDMQAAFARLADALGQISANIRRRGEEWKFARHDEFGYLSMTPSRIGTALFASVTLRLPFLSRQPDFPATCEGMGLVVRPVPWSSCTANEGSDGTSGVYELANMKTAGLSEVDVVNEVIAGCAELVRMEMDLERQAGGHALVVGTIGELAEGFCGEDTASHGDLASRVASVPAERPRCENQHVFLALPGLGDSDFPGFPPDVCPESVPDFAGNCSLMAQVFRDDPAMFSLLRARSTRGGVSLARCIKPGMDAPATGSVGVVAGDSESYTVFREMFAKVVHALHGEVPTGPHPQDLCSSSVSNQLADPSGCHVLSVQVRCYRNLQGCRFAPACSREERREVERAVIGALMRLPGQDLQGTYFPLEHSTSCPSRPSGMSKDEAHGLMKHRYLFQAPEGTAPLASGLGRHWPDARGVFVANSRSLVVWCNESDHLQLMSCQRGGDLKATFARLSKVLLHMESSLTAQDGSYSFARCDDFGYLSACPSRLGASLFASMALQLPVLSRQPSFLAMCEDLGLRARPCPRGGAEADGAPDTFSVENINVVGLSEADIVNQVIAGCAELVRREEHLSGTSANPCPVLAGQLAQAFREAWNPRRSAAVLSQAKLKEVLGAVCPGLTAVEVDAVLHALPRREGGDVNVNMFIEWLYRK